MRISRLIKTIWSSSMVMFTLVFLHSVTYASTEFADTRKHYQCAESIKLTGMPIKVRKFRYRFSDIRWIWTSHGFHFQLDDDGRDSVLKEDDYREIYVLDGGVSLSSQKTNSTSYFATLWGKINGRAKVTSPSGDWAELKCLVEQTSK